MRRRLMMGALYLLVVVVVGLTVPFGATQGRLLTGELAGRVEREAFAAGAAVEDELEAGNTAGLQPSVERFAQEIGGRILLTDRTGLLLADSLQPPGAAPPSYAGRPEIATALRGTPNWEVRASRTLGHDILVSAVPIRSAGRVLGVIRISYPMTEVRRATHRAYLFLGLVGASTLLIGLLVAAALARWASRPLRDAALVARRITEGDLEARVPERGPPEVRELAADLNAMTATLGQLLKANGEFAADASHQLRTPLAALRLHLEEALDGPDPRSEMRAAIHQADRMADIVGALLALGQTTERRGQAVDVSAMGREAWSDLQRAEITFTVSGHGRAAADPERLAQVLTNLLANASRFARRHVALAVTEEDGLVSIAVDDDGPGVPADERDRVFDRFFRGAVPRGGGSGLGLAVARELARADAATISVGEGPLGGARFLLVYPAAARESTAETIR